MRFFVNKLLFLKSFLILCFLTSSNVYSIDNDLINNSSLSFSKINLQNSTINESDYFEFIRDSIITQPEFLYANSKFLEKNQALKFEQRQRWPELSVRIINDQVIDRKVNELTSLRKRQDDSFDAAFELS